ncbi:uncharacterized protein Dere_GG26897, partial [Drosophila erecta]
KVNKHKKIRRQLGFSLPLRSRTITKYNRADQTDDDIEIEAWLQQLGNLSYLSTPPEKLKQEVGGRTRLSRSLRKSTQCGQKVEKVSEEKGNTEH